MALIFNGTEILSNMDLVFNGVSLDVINFNDNVESKNPITGTKEDKNTLSIFLIINV